MGKRKCTTAWGVLDKREKKVKELEREISKNPPRIVLEEVLRFYLALGSDEDEDRV